MDKQKQIEEMARDIAIAGKVASEWLCEETKSILREKGNFKSTEHTKTLSDIVAEELAKMGYRKIPEGAVVFTREEYEKLQALKDDYVKGYEAGVDEGWDNACKETAEKFARLVEFHSVSTRDENGREMFTISALGLKEILHEEFGIPYDEICKGISEGNV